MKQNEFAKWLKFITITTGIIGLFFCFLIVPGLGRHIASANPEFSYMFMPSLMFIWITAIPFYLALWKAWRICCEISKDHSFSEKNAKALKYISRLALVEYILYLFAMVVLLFLNLLHPSILLISLFIIFVGISVGIVSAVLSHLVQKANDIKQENDLTI